MKAYGLEAEGQAVTVEMIAQAQRVLDTDVTSEVVKMGASNDLGFVIIHPGTIGLSITSHWWVQGSVLCHHIVRQLYTAEHPMDAGTRPVIGCVWELEIIAAEQAAFRRHMMGRAQDPAEYLAEQVPET